MPDQKVKPVVKLQTPELIVMPERRKTMW